MWGGFWGFFPFFSRQIFNLLLPTFRDALRWYLHFVWLLVLLVSLGHWFALVRPRILLINSLCIFTPQIEIFAVRTLTFKIPIIIHDAQTLLRCVLVARTLRWLYYYYSFHDDKICLSVIHLFDRQIVFIISQSCTLCDGQETSSFANHLLSWTCSSVWRLHICAVPEFLRRRLK